MWSRRAARRRLSRSGEAFDDRPELVERTDEERADPEALAELGELLDEPVDRADEDVGRIDHVLLRHLLARPLADPVDDLARLGVKIVGDRDRPLRRVDVERQ